MQLKFDILSGHAESVLKSFPDNFFDSCILDGPYNLGFMSSAWDTFKGHQQFQQWYYDLAKEILRVLKPGAYFLSFGGTRAYHRMISGIEDAGFEIRDCIMWVYGSGFPKSHNIDGGFGSAIKPAWEPICMARKPLEGTIQQNFDKYGTGVLNIDAARIQGEPWVFGTQTNIKGGKFNTARPSDGDVHARNVIGGENGRWPANIIHDGSPEVIKLFPNTKSGTGAIKKKSSKGHQGKDYGKESRKAGTSMVEYGDSGSAARFFYCAKASRADRNQGLEDLEKRDLLLSSGTKNPGSFQSTNTDRSAQNNHPTVKPTALMRYLAKLVTPPGGHIIDPCCGSGSTGKGAIFEGFQFTGIDKEPKWVTIATKRCESAAVTFNRMNRQAVFDFKP